MQLPNICHITSIHSRYDSRIFLKECQTLANAGFKVHLLVADGYGDALIDNIYIYDVGKAKNRLLRIVQTAQRMYQKIVSLNITIVHLHDPELLLIANKLMRKKIKIIYDAHEDIAKQILSKHWLPRYLRPLVAHLATSYEKKISKRLAAIVAATPNIAKRLSSYNPNTVIVANYPILNDVCANASDIVWQSRENSICYIGSISRNRGIVPLVNSLAFSKCKLYLAGALSGDISIAEILALDGGQYVEYLGVLNKVEVNTLLRRVKIGVVTLLPTPSYLESLPIKLFEYMSSGLAIVASAFTLWQQLVAVAEAGKKIQCATLVDPNNSNAIATACLELLTNDQLAEEYGKNGIYLVRKYFSWHSEAAKLINLYSNRFKLDVCC